MSQPNSGEEISLPDLSVDPKQAYQMLATSIEAGLVPLLSGSPGCGKSAIVHQLAEEYGLKVIDVRLAQCDPTDLLGFPTVDKERHKASYMPMETFPIQGDKVPEGYNGWMLFLDELPLADRSVQKAAYKVILDKMVGNYHLHPNVAIVAAGNLETDNAMVEEMSTALQSRLIHMTMKTDYQQWIDWAIENDIDYRITSYINFAPGKLYTFTPDHPDSTYASPRTWAFASKLLEHMEPNHPLALNLFAGTVSQGVAREFLAFTRIYQSLPTIAQIRRDPKNTPVPLDEPNKLYALTGFIANHVTEEAIKPLMEYVCRLPVEFQVICLRELIRRDRDMLDHPEVDEWVTNNSTKLY